MKQLKKQLKQSPIHPFEIWVKRVLPWHWHFVALHWFGSVYIVCWPHLGFLRLWLSLTQDSFPSLLGLTSLTGEGKWSLW